MFSQLSSVQFTLEVKGIRLYVRRKLSNDHPGVTCEQCKKTQRLFFFDLGDEILPNYMGIIIGQYQDPSKPISRMKCHKGLFHAAQLSSLKNPFSSKDSGSYLMFGCFRGWRFPYIGRTHAAYIGEDSSILGIYLKMLVMLPNLYEFMYFFFDERCVKIYQRAFDDDLWIL